VLNKAHPDGIAVVADRSDCLLGVLAIEDGAVRLLDVDRREFDKLVHPVRPEMLWASGLVIAEDAV
jgi:hypothetical protein